MTTVAMTTTIATAITARDCDNDRGHFIPSAKASTDIFTAVAVAAPSPSVAARTTASAGKRTSANMETCTSTIAESRASCCTFASAIATHPLQRRAGTPAVQRLGFATPVLL